MKHEAPVRHQLNEQTIKAAATAAVRDLQLDAEVKSVNAEKGRWCVQFTADYGQCCDTFLDRFGKENSSESIREKVKRHILKQQQNKIRSNVRIRKGQEQQHPVDNLFATALQTLEAVATHAAEVTGDIINQAARLPEQALTTLTGTANLSRTPQPPSPAAPTTQPSARVIVRAASGVKSNPARSKRKVSSKGRTASSKKRKGSAKKSRAVSAAKKSGAVSKTMPKAAIKKPRAARKAAAPPTQKRSGTTRKRGGTKRGAKGKKYKRARNV